MRKQYTINFQSEWNKEGTHYNQCINLKQRTYDELLLKLQAEIELININKVSDIEDFNFYKHMNLKRTIKNINNTYFLNLTQRDFFNKFLKLNLLDRNTRIFIIN